MGPVVAVLVGHFFQNRAEKRRDKMNVFTAIMTDRYGWSKETVLALNSIPIVFSKDTSVREKWKEYYKMLCIQEPNDIQLKERNDALYKLLESMADALGYKGVVNWDDIQNPYIPRGMAVSFDNSFTIQSAIASIVKNMNNIGAYEHNNKTNQFMTEKEDKI